MLVSVLKHTKIHKSTRTCFDLNRSSSGSILFCYKTSLKLLNYLKIEFKIHKNHSRCCGSAPRVTAYTGYTFCSSCECGSWPL